MGSRSDFSIVGKRVVITGGAGFIGRRVASHLALRDAEVVVVGQERDGSAGLGFVEADLENPAATREALEGADAVIHLAARSGGIAFQDRSSDEIFWANTTMTRNVLHAAAEFDVRRVFLASSAVVYSRHAEGPLVEGSTMVSPSREPVSPYAWSKLTDEAQAQWWAPQVSTVIGRFTNIYGPGAPSDGPSATVVHSLVKRAIDAAPDGNIVVWGDGTPVRSFMYVDDAAAAVVRVVERGISGGTYNIAPRESSSIADLAILIRDLAAPDANLSFDRSKPTGPPHRLPDPSALEQLGHRDETSLEEGVAAVVEDHRRPSDR